MELTKEEQDVINTLKRLAKRWPDSLWVFCGEGFNVMKMNEKGERAVTRNGGMDSAFVVATIDIDSDGGAW